MEHVVPAIAGGVHMRVDKAGGHELATCRETRVDCACIGTASVHNAIVVVHHAAVFIHLMAGAVKRHHPAAFDKRFHTSPLGRRYTVCLCGGDCTEGLGGSQHWGSGSVGPCFTAGHFTA